MQRTNEHLHGCPVASAPSHTPSPSTMPSRPTGPTQAARHGHHAHYPHLAAGGQALLVRGLQRAAVWQRGLRGGREAGEGQGVRGQGARFRTQGASHAACCAATMLWVEQHVPPLGSARSVDVARAGPGVGAPRPKLRHDVVGRLQVTERTLLRNDLQAGSGRGRSLGHGRWESGS